MTKNCMSKGLCLLAALLVGVVPALAAKPQQPPEHVVPLTATGQTLLAKYTAMLQELRGKIVPALPNIDPAVKQTFMTAYRAQTKQKPYVGRVAPLLQAIAQCQQTAAPILAATDSYLSSDKLDAALVKASVIADATPRGLAEFAEQSPANEALIDKLLNDPALMKQMQVAGGARDGNYGRTMQIYEAIQKASTHAQAGILQRLALGTALAQKPLQPAANERVTFDPVARFLDYQKAYLDGELDPSFPIFTTWECRFITNEPYSDQDIDWCRQMTRNYEPQTLIAAATKENRRSHYGTIVHTDVGYGPMHLGCVPGNMPAQLIAGGAVCGGRAWVGRLSERSFGIPTWGVRQPGHAALSHWTPNGWYVFWGAGWPWADWNDRIGLDFELSSQARWYPKLFMKALRARWTGWALGEPKQDRLVPGTGGFWFALANCEERAIVASGKPTRVIPTLAELEKQYGPTQAQKLASTPVPASARQVSADRAGVIHVPAAACSNPTRSEEGVLFTKSFLGGMQMHYAKAYEDGRRWKTAHVSLEYHVDAPHAGPYRLVAKFVVMKLTQHLLVTVNNAQTPSEITLPWTNGMWQTTKPVAVTLKKGPNVLVFSQPKDFHSVTLKDFTLVPVM